MNFGFSAESRGEWDLNPYVLAHTGFLAPTYRLTKKVFSFGQPVTSLFRDLKSRGFSFGKTVDFSFSQKEKAWWLKAGAFTRFCHLRNLIKVGECTTSVEVELA